MSKSSHGKHTRNPGFKSGDNWAECSRCSFDVYASELKEEYTGLLVCPECHETRHPQDYVKGIKEDTSPIGSFTGELSKIPSAIIQLLDTDTTVDINTGNRDYSLSVSLTADRVITLVPSNLPYQELTISREAPSPFSLGIGGVYTIKAGITGTAILQYYGNTYNLINFTAF